MFFFQIGGLTIKYVFFGMSHELFVLWFNGTRVTRVNESRKFTPDL